jgi:glycosyltransferase involved in cell wall biosynthesis
VRILILHEDTRPPGMGGGAEAIVRDFGAAMKARGHTVCWWWGHGDIKDAIAEFKPDMIHAMTMHNFIPNWMGVMRWIQKQKIPHVWVMMDYWPFCGNRMLLRGPDDGETCSAAEGFCDGMCAVGPAPAAWAELVNGSPVVALNEYSRDILKRNGIRCDYVVEPGIDTEIFQPGEKVKDSIITSSAWASAPAKGMAYLKEALL